MRLVPPLALVLLVAILPLVVSQEPVDPLADKAQEKAAEAQADPAGFVERQASPQEIERDAAWGVAYACYALDYAGEETGVEPPSLEACADYEDVLGQGKKEAPPAAVSEVEPLENETLVEEVVGTVGDVLEDPPSAPNPLLRLLDRIVQFVADLVGGIVSAVGAAFGLSGSTAQGIASGTGAVAHAVAAGVTGAAGAVWDGAASAIDSVTGAVEGAARGVGRAVVSSVEAVKDAAATAGRAVDEARRDVSDWFASLWTDEPAAGPEQEPLSTVEVPAPEPGLLDGLPCVDCLLE